MGTKLRIKLHAALVFTILTLAVRVCSTDGNTAAKMLEMGASHVECVGGAGRCIHMYGDKQLRYTWHPYGTSLTCRLFVDPWEANTWPGACQAGKKGHTGVVIGCNGTESGFKVEYESLVTGKTTLLTFGKAVALFSKTEPAMGDLNMYVDAPIEAADTDSDVWINCPMNA